MTTDAIQDVSRHLVRDRWPHRPMTTGGLPDEALVKWQPNRKEIEKWVERAIRLTMEATAASFTHGCSDEKIEEICAAITRRMEAENGGD